MSQEKLLDANWVKWAKTNILRGCNPEEVSQILQQNNFSIYSINAVLNQALLEKDNPANTNSTDYQALANIPLTAEGSGAEKIQTDKAQIYLFENFFSTEECKSLIQLIDKNLRPSTISIEDSDKYFRTSSTSDLTAAIHPLVKELDERIYKTLGIDAQFAEITQAQKYEIGQEFKAHTDYFEPYSEEYSKYCKIGGNRTWTFMVYLNDTNSGGGTKFVNLAKTFYPKAGVALAWNNLQQDGWPNPDTIHHGMPVIEGEKYIITKWFREKAINPSI